MNSTKQKHCKVV